MSKAKEVIMRLAVMLIFLANVENTLVNSALGEITRANPDVNSSVISLVSTLPIIVMFVMSFFVAKIINHSNKKTLVLIALIIYTIGGVMGTFLAENIYMLLVARAVLGVGSGIAAPLSGTIIAQLFSGKDRTRMYGMTNAVSALVGALITMIGGFLMMIQWNYIFLAYSSMIIVIALVAVGMPSMPAEKMAEPSEKKQKIKLSGGQRGELTVLSVFMFFNTLAGWFILLKLAINITENNIGTAVLSSTAMSVFNVVVMVSSFIYIFIKKFLKRYTPAISAIIPVVGVIILLKLQTPAGVIAGMILMGFGTGVLMPSMEDSGSGIVSKEHAAQVMAIIFGAFYLAQIAATFFESFLGLFCEPTTELMWIIAIVFFLSITVMYLIYVIVTNKKQSLSE